MQDLIIIGAGPAGIYAGFQAGLRNIKATILESLAIPGGLLTTFYPDKPIYDIPGFPGIRADAFIANLIAQWQPYAKDVPMVFHQTLKSITSIPGGYEVITTQAQKYQAKMIILASGTGSLIPRKLEVAIEDVSILPHIHYGFHQANLFHNKRIAIFGGGDSALDWANQLTSLASSVTVIHRRAEFRAMNQSLASFQTKGTLLAPAELSGIKRTPQGIELRLKTPSEEKTLIVDDILVAYGFSVMPQLKQDWGVKSSIQGMLVNHLMETNLANIFAVGNASTYEGKGENIASALGETAAVMETIQHRLFPGKKIIYSSFLKP